MRRLTAALLLLSGCNRPSAVHPTVLEEEPKLAAVIAIADPKTEHQILRGFHPKEPDGWRWTMAKFGVTLQPPRGATENGARLMLKFTLPAPVIDRVKSVTLSVAVNGVSIPSETYTKTGEYTYRQDVPAAALAPNVATATGAAGVEFTLDHFLKSGDVEDRELGLVVTMMGLEAK